MAGVALACVTLIACVLLLLLVRLEVNAAAPVRYEQPDTPDPPPPPPPPPPMPQYIEPVCQVTFGKAVCQRAGDDTPCPPAVDQVRHDTQAGATGAWTLSPTYTYFLDRGLVGELAQLFAAASVIELGAGKGCYAATLRRLPPRRPGESRIAVRAFDGAPNVVSVTGGLVQHADLVKPLRLSPAEWVLCLETAEHIPREYESQLLENLDKLNTVGIVLSWSNNAGGNGHVNLRTNQWVVQRFAQMGYDHDERAERALRRSVNAIHWFRDTLLVFRRTVTRGGERGASA